MTLKPVHCTFAPTNSAKTLLGFTNVNKLHQQHGLLTDFVQNYVSI